MQRKIIIYLMCIAVMTLFLQGYTYIEKRKAGGIVESNIKRPEHDVIVKNGIRYFYPDLISGGASVRYIFPVSQPNTVGTIDRYINGISFIEFSDENRKPRIRFIARNFSSEVYGNFTYRLSPNFSDDMIVYSKTRVAVIVNVKTGEAFHARFGLTSDDYMLGIRFLDPENNLLVVVKCIGRDIGFDDPRPENLHLARLEGKRLVDLGEIMPRVRQNNRISQDFPSYNHWLVLDRKIIAYDAHNTKDMLCFNALEKITHPFAEVFNRNKDKIRELRDFVVHPELPFGVVIEEVRVPNEFFDLPRETQRQYLDSVFVHPLHSLRWNTDDSDEQFSSFNNILLPLAGIFGVKHLAVAYPSFSPDGKWLVLGCFKYNVFDGEIHFIAIPVDFESPTFLNFKELVVLGDVFQTTSLAWSTEPTALVVSDGYTLHKWNLGELDKARIITVPDPDSSDSGSLNPSNRKDGFFKRLGSLFRKDGGPVA